MHEYDKSSKWLVQHDAASILRLCGIGDVDRWRALPPELVQPRRHADGLIEARRKGSAEPDLFLLEMANRGSPPRSWRVCDRMTRGSSDCSGGEKP